MALNASALAGARAELKEIEKVGCHSVISAPNPRPCGLFGTLAMDDVAKDYEVELLRVPGRPGPEPCD